MGVEINGRVRGTRKGPEGLYILEVLVDVWIEDVVIDGTTSRVQKDIGPVVVEMVTRLAIRRHSKLTVKGEVNAYSYCGRDGKIKNKLAIMAS